MTDTSGADERPETTTPSDGSDATGSTAPAASGEEPFAPPAPRFTPPSGDPAPSGYSAPPPSGYSAPPASGSDASSSYQAPPPSGYQAPPPPGQGYPSAPPSAGQGYQAPPPPAASYPSSSGQSPTPPPSSSYQAPPPAASAAPVAQPSYQAPPPPASGGYGAPNPNAAPAYGQSPYGASSGAPGYGQGVPTQPPGSVPPGSLPPGAVPPPGYYGGYPAPPSAQTNVLAIITIIAAFVFSPVGIVTGHIALSQIKRTHEGGQGLAKAGLIVSYVFTGIAVLGIIAYVIFIIIIFATVGVGSAAYSY
ncbi:DUF4190 domain-containing protein [Cnuibacter physcomitrellae]|uniref:DUF4190 domain-containing protein n=1 Tax=Cnuibacter physcomitrellae TaxID=1619308 RepID=UPI00217619D0|nr:DUF4190 domain-containing protein [Cnuibacter physcomitrellae]MCS5499238.1 DUF4190 domain-containing protein [Cnuibacter physcomitrellae]